ncbi:MAG TPA: DUF87 domain-containing protein [Candidatus Limnocylindria bacterium]|nr:DUF87 domain-containing protein [Candidatus Limnocylindria bacterium]
METSTTLEWFHKLEGLLPLVVTVLVSAAVIGVVAIVILNLLDFWRLLKQKSIFLELTPPANTDWTPDANQRLFAVLHAAEDSRSLPDKLMRRKVVFTPEIPSTRGQGIRYIMRVPADEADSYAQKIASHDPGVKVRQVDDYLPENLDWRSVRVLSFRQTNSFAYPLRTQTDLERQDPVAYINGAMTQLHQDELVALQLVITPARVREAEIIQNRLTHNEMLVTHLGKRRFSGGKVLELINTLLFGILDLVGDTVHGPSRSMSTSQRTAYRRQEVASKIRPARTLSLIEEELAESVNRKLQQPLFRVDIRALVIAKDKQRRKQRANDIRNALDAFKVAKYQSLKARFGFPAQLKGRYRLFAFQHRLPSIFARGASILAASEVADIFHFPHSQSAKTENVVKSLSKTLPAPLSLKNGTKLDVLFGRNHHLGTGTDIGLTAAERERHMYVIGGTGNGKTTMLKYQIVQDIQNGKGVAVVDPHGDLAEELLGYIPEDRIDDVVYLNPDDLDRPIGINLLELPPGLEGNALKREKDLITESTISVMRKIFSEDDSGGHRIEYVLRNTIQTALTLENPTLFTIFRLLNDGKFSKGVIKNLEDHDLKLFWKNEFGKAGGMQKVKMVAGITAKIGRFLFSASARGMLEQEKSTIDFNEILDGKKILICNFSKGLLGEDTSMLFGVTILAKLQLASLRRARQKQASRSPYYLYVDEFQNFATMSFVQMLSEARKYKVFLTMAEQSTQQQADQKLVDIILANVGTVVAFRSGSPADERLIQPLFAPYVEEGELSNLPAYSFYTRIAAMHAQEPMSGVTVLLDVESNAKVAERARAESRTKYGREVERVEAKPPLKHAAKPKKIESTEVAADLLQVEESA